MIEYKCKCCGANLEYVAGKSTIKCSYCDSWNTVSTTSDAEIRNLFDRANALRYAREFDRGEKAYENLIEKVPTDAEAYWGLLLCKYGIEYVVDPETRLYVPTCHRASYDSILTDDDYKNVLKYAGSADNEVYVSQAKEIDRIQKEIVTRSLKEDVYDIFISYKDTDDRGDRTEDSLLAYHLYDRFTKEGYKVFYSRVSLENALGEDYEPHIFAALNSAKVMLVVGTRPEYFNAVWVKNEWSRYLKIVKKDVRKKLIPCFKFMSPAALPVEFKYLQAQDMSKIGFEEDLLLGIKKVIPKTAPKLVSVAVNVDALVERAFMLIEDGDYAAANQLLEQALNNAPKKAEAYLAKLLIDLKLHKEEDLEKQKEPFDSNGNYQKTVRFAEPDLKARLTSYNAAIRERIELEKKEKIYAYALNKSKSNDVKALDEAISYFRKIPDYKDSTALIAECEQRKILVADSQKEKRFASAYATAKNKMGSTDIKDVMEAKEIFVKLGGYKDSKELIAKCDENVLDLKLQNKYYKALKLAENGTIESYQSAIDALNEIKDYGDSKDLIVKYQNAIEDIRLKSIKRKKTSKIIAISALVLVVLALALGLVFGLKGKIAGNLSSDSSSSSQQDHSGGNSTSGDGSASHTHVYGAWEETVAPTCTTKGQKERVCSCGEKETEDVASLDHNYTPAVTAPTCTEQGYTTYTCTRCGDSYKDNYVDALNHNYSNGVCTHCGDFLYKRVDTNDDEDEDGDYIYFGTYPQSEAKDESLVEALNEKAGTLPAEIDRQKWTSYGYYINGDVYNYMWYIDVENNGDKYRGVYFTSYRPYWTTGDSSASNSNQDDNGYTTSTVYWFKYEPIKWRILNESNGEALIFSEMAIDNQNYYITSSGSTRTIDGKTVYENNYEYSTIRAWLNDTFYNTAFTSLQKQLIIQTTVDNSARSTSDSGNNLSQATSYYCNDTKDYIFLLSEQEVTTSSYGFDSSYSAYDTARQKKNTDYAKCQDAYTSTDGSYNGNGYWWLRSPIYFNSRSARYVDYNGYADICLNDIVDYTGGVVPALKINLSGEVHTHVYGDWEEVVAPTCTTKGQKERVCSCGAKETEDVAALDHNYTTAVTAPTCTEQGYTTYTCIRCGDSYKSNYVNATGHTPIEIAAVAATCTEDGSTAGSKCKVCGVILTATKTVNKLGHNYNSAITSPTCTEQGYTTYTCTRCGDSYKDNYVDALNHNYSNGVCTRCGAAENSTLYKRVNANDTENSKGNYIYFGSYPQTKVTDSSLSSALSTKAGTLPTSSNSQKWTSYGYYINGSVSNYMWYIDVEYSGEKHRGVYFTSYRPNNTTVSSSASNSNQDDNGYTTSTVYWFKYEPIKWRILDESNGEALVFSEMAIDSQNYYITSSGSTRTIDGKTVYENNYEYSTIRTWLNDTFYNTAFTSLQKALIIQTTVDNSARSTSDSSNNLSQATYYYCNDTKDYIFLLSEQEVTTSSYGFNSSSTAFDTARQKKNTGYAECQGAWAGADSSYYDNGWWWLRSPLYNNSSRARSVGNGGYAGSSDVLITCDGVVPALKIKLS
ncbi:MAG: TIR domain-containing protein [Clostridia bacterium]|nr:TIR domain-containing protein [Clostridia bacterium]